LPVLFEEVELEIVNPNFGEGQIDPEEGGPDLNLINREDNINMADQQQLLEAINTMLAGMVNHQNNNAALMGQFNQNQGPRTATMALIPTFSGRATESLADWEGALARAAVSDHWNDGMRRRAAITKLDGAALAWHDHTGYALVEWNDWIAGIRTLFQPRLSLTEWCLLVEQRTQLPGESGVEYSMEKARLFLHELQDQEKVDYFDRGSEDCQN